MPTGPAPSATAPTSQPQRPDFTAAQQHLIVATASAIVRAAAICQTPAIADPTLGGAAERIVSGVFVSLKRRGHLRSCCGVLGQPVPVGRALHEAATRTAGEDMRFPPVCAAELEHLDIEVWLLYNPEPVQARGEERLRAVTVGKHGVQVVRGQARGLLLPSVAIEHQWDVERFLDQVCVKAGLHPTLWRDDETQLFTFEGDAIQGRVLAAEEAASLPASSAPLRPEEVQAYADFCRGNIVALLYGATPNYYLMGAPDGHVTGIALTVKRPGSAEDLNLSQLSLRPGVPLQSTLFSVAQSMARALAAQRIREQELAALQVGLTVFYDPAMHGTVADPDLGGINAQRRALLVMERSKMGLVLDPESTPEELLAESVRQAQVSHPATTAVFSLGTVTTTQKLVISTVPRPVRGPAVRPAGVAGSFYPADVDELVRLVDDLVAGERDPRPWPAAMVPHAGLIYSGRIAASVLKRIQIPSTIIVIGPKHTAAGVDWAVAPHQTWSLPGGDVESDFMLARQLCAAIPGLQMDAVAHQREHAIEVELPLLARLAPNTRVVGIALGSGDLENCQGFAEGLANVVRDQKERPLLLISSDMNHFATDAENRRLDAIAIAALERLDPELVYETVTENRISMCGLVPAVIVLETLKRLGGLTKAERVAYATSADVTGNTSRVVGYAGMLFR